MFTGITQGLKKVIFVRQKDEILQIGIELDAHLTASLEIGASIAVDGVCLTVTKIDGLTAYFDIIPETLKKTTLFSLLPGRLVNIERSARYGDEIGGHLVSGHVWGRAKIIDIIENPQSRIIVFSFMDTAMKYLFPKGFIAIDGSSLTLVDVDPKGKFTVHLIPETLQRSVLGLKNIGDEANIEIDAHTQAIVDTVERYIASNQKLTH